MQNIKKKNNTIILMQFSSSQNVLVHDPHCNDNQNKSPLQLQYHYFVPFFFLNGVTNDPVGVLHRLKRKMEQTSPWTDTREYQFTHLSSSSSSCW